MGQQPDTIGKYNIEGVLGRGAMGVVYKGFDPNIARSVAIKTIHKNLLNSEVGREMLRRFRVEAQAVGKLTHPNIVGIFEFDQDRGTPYFVMEFVEGRDLKSLIQDNDRFSVERIIEIITAILDGLEYTHEFGIVHRDIKPANIFITNKGIVKIADFGIARVDNSEMTQVGSVLGTPSYMSPEQCIGAVVDARSDLFSTGVVLYELLTGSKPFQAAQTSAVIQNVINKQPDDPTDLKPDLPRAFNTIIKKALAKHVEHRYQTASEFKTDLVKVLEGKPVRGPNFGALKMFVTVAMVIALAGGGYLVALFKERNGNGQANGAGDNTTTPLSVENTTTGIAGGSNPQSNLSPEEQEKVGRLLDVARAHFLVGRLVSPQGSNAFEAYQMVLQTDSKNADALEGIAQVKQRFFKRAKILFQQGQVGEAQQHLKLAEDLFKGDAELAELRALLPVP